MDLWIRSQDRKRLVPDPNLYVVYDEKNEIAYIGDTSVGHIGKYKTEERALKVLDNIETHIRVVGKIDTIDASVYQLPKE